MAIKMVGTRVWVTLNGKPTVDGQVLDNFFDRKAAGAADRIDRAADARIGSALPQHLRPRDSGGGREKLLETVAGGAR